MLCGCCCVVGVWVVVWLLCGGLCCGCLIVVWLLFGCCCVVVVWVVVWLLCGGLCCGCLVVVCLWCLHTQDKALYGCIMHGGSTIQYNTSYIPARV